MTARDIYSFMTLNNQLQIHKNAIEIAWSESEARFQMCKVPDRLWIVTLTHLTGRTNKLQSILPRV